MSVTPTLLCDARPMRRQMNACRIRFAISPFGTHETPQVVACHAEQYTRDGRAGAHQRWLVVQHVELARELVVAEIDHGFGRVLFAAGVDVDAAFEDNEHVGAALATRKDRTPCGL